MGWRLDLSVWTYYLHNLIQIFELLTTTISLPLSFSLCFSLPSSRTVFHMPSQLEKIDVQHTENSKLIRSNWAGDNTLKRNFIESIFADHASKHQIVYAAQIKHHKKFAHVARCEAVIAFTLSVQMRRYLFFSVSKSSCSHFEETLNKAVKIQCLSLIVNLSSR